MMSESCSRRIAVLMACYNRVNVTLGCLSDLFSQRELCGFKLDVFLVDDASPDNTGERVAERFPSVNVIKSDGGLYWCKGMRLAWEHANSFGDYDFYLWLNDDVRLKDSAVHGLLQDYDVVHSVVVGTFSSDESYSDVSYGATNSMPNGAPRIADKPMNGNLVLVPKSTYDIIGPICGEYHHQYGDYDYGMMMQRRGLAFYTSSAFSGICPQQPHRYLHLKGRTLLQRLQLLFDPKGYDVHDAFLFSLRNRGLIRALLSVAHVVVKVVMGGA